MGRKIEVTISNHFEFDEEYIRENYQGEDEFLTDNELLEAAEEIVNNLDGHTILDTAYVEAVFYE